MPLGASRKAKNNPCQPFKSGTFLRVMDTELHSSHRELRLRNHPQGNDQGSFRDAGPHRWILGSALQRKYNFVAFPYSIEKSGTLPSHSHCASIEVLVAIYKYFFGLHSPCLRAGKGTVSLGWRSFFPSQLVGAHFGTSQCCACFVE